ncbi:MAG: selenide, water dikinase SelD [Planctomycetota bacterium]|nr:MAG: selenide, water dikinase SelD [Planctomycetota bacterium]
MPQGELAQVLRLIAPATRSADLIVGPDSFDDAAALRRDGKVQLFTTDFFPPVLDDPGSYGAVAAANSLSDIYAMGGEATAVLNIAGFPQDWGPEILEPIFEAAAKKVMESGAIWVGGHTMRAVEPFFGFAAFGEVAEDQLVTNRDARPGDLLYLSKPLGSGSITTGVKQGKTRDKDMRAAAAGMAQLNRTAAAAMRAAGVRAGTDITGFGLFGHAGNIARGSDATILLRAVALPLYAGAAELAAKGIYSGGVERGKQSLGGLVEIAPGIPAWLSDLCYDSETSGGILACVPEAAQQRFLDAFPDDHKPVLVGEVEAGPARVVLR